MYLRAGVLSLGLLIASRILGLLRESVQAATFGSTGLGDAVIVMFTLPDLLVGILFSGALSYVLLPLWAHQSAVQLASSQARVARVLLAASVVMGGLVWLGRDAIGHALAPGLTGEMKALGASSLGWSAAVLPLAMIAALWVTRLQHERDFVGMYAGNLLVNLFLVGSVFLVAFIGFGRPLGATVTVLGSFLVLAMLARLGWLYWRLPRRLADGLSTTGLAAELPKISVWLAAALSSGLLLLLPLIGRSLASQGGEGALASFNYAWKLIELPLVLAIQLVASLAFPAITRTAAGSEDRRQALQIAFGLAWALACAAIVVVATFSRPLAGLLFGWGRMNAAGLQTIAQWSAVGVWSLLPQALIAVLLTQMAIAQKMHVAVWTYSVGVAALLLAGWLGLAGGTGSGLTVMFALNGVTTGIALTLLISQRRSLLGAVPVPGMLAALAVCLLLVSCRVWLVDLTLPGAAATAAICALLVLMTAVFCIRPLRGVVFLLATRVGLLRKRPDQPT